MLNLTNYQKRKLLEVARRLNVEEVEEFEKQYLMSEKIVGMKRAIRFQHKEFKNIIEFAKKLDADFVMSNYEEQSLNECLDEPIEVTWEGFAYKTVPNENYLPDKTLPQIHAYINKTLSNRYDTKNYTKAIAFVYNYLVENNLEHRAMDIKNIKKEILRTKKDQSSNTNNKPKEEKKYFEQNATF